MDVKITFSARFHYREGLSIVPHSHLDNQIQLVYGGTARSRLNDEEFSISSGDILFVRKGDFHAYTVTSPEGMRTMEVKFVTQDPSVQTLLDGVPSLFQDVDQQLFNVFTQIVLEGQRQNIEYKCMSEVLLMQVIIISARICARKAITAFETGSPIARSVQEGLASSVIDLVDDFIAHNINRSFSLQEVADGCGYSKDQIYRTIHKEKGMSAISYINRRRFDRARDMVKHTDLSLSEIAWNLGFENLQYFSRFFRRYAGTSPSDYCAKVRDTVRIKYL